MSVAPAPTSRGRRAARRAGPDHRRLGLRRRLAGARVRRRRATRWSALSRTRRRAPTAAARASRVDLRDAEAVRERGARGRAPTSSTTWPRSARSAARGRTRPTTLAENGASAVNVLEAVRHEAPGARVVWVSSCEVYGTPATLPIAEDAPLAPGQPLRRLQGRPASCSPRCTPTPTASTSSAPGRSATPGPASCRSSCSPRWPGRPPRAGCAGVDAAADRHRQPGHAPRLHRRARRRARLPAAAPSRGATAGASTTSAPGVSVSAAEQVALLAELIAPIEVEHEVDPARVRAHEVMDLRGDPRAAAPPPPAGSPRSRCARRWPTRSRGGRPSCRPRRLSGSLPSRPVAGPARAATSTDSRARPPSSIGRALHL